MPTDEASLVPDKDPKGKHAEERLKALSEGGR